MFMQPADSVIAKLGGVAKTAAAAGVHRTRVSNWKRPRDAGGTGGRIPQKHIEALIAHARQNGIALSLEDFFEARPGNPIRGAA
jgi:hypothetical protein